jgi:uncharacterized protein (TIGR02594 family)
MKWPQPLPAWINEAFRNIGLREIPGKNNNPTIIKWLIQLKAWWSEDETPWCGTFVAHCLMVAGMPVPKFWMRAKEYANYGAPLSINAASIPLGAICVKSRVGGGHVFFPIARTSDNRYVFGLGGNQRNMVNITRFLIDQIDAVRWPGGTTTRIPLPIATDTEIQAASTGGSEA